MKVHIMNSATMPKPGKYELTEISESEFVAFLRAAAQEGTLESSIGYPQNQQWIQDKSGVKVPLSRNPTRLKSGDTMLIMRLPYRSENKGREVDTSDFELFKATYE